MTWERLPNELQLLADSLAREEATASTGNFLYQEAARFRHEWKEKSAVTATLLPLPLPRNQGLHPVGCEPQASYLSFRFQMSYDDLLPKRADYQVRIEGLLCSGEAIIQLEDHWRIDTDIYASPFDSDKNVPKAAKEPHPFFHFQRGGHAQDAFASLPGFFPSVLATVDDRDWKGLMQYPGPRIPILPMDPILAIDFCISQNNGLIWQRLRNSPEYYSLIEEAQKRLWMPLFESLVARDLRRRWLGPLVAI